MSLEASTPLNGYPQTLRDFSLTQVLSLPSTFGSIQLGETFSSVLSINNEAALKVLGIFIKVEMQTATNKFSLQEMGGDGRLGLDSSEIAETVVHHEIKELGQHVLACTISYHVPPQLRNPAFPPEDPANPTLRTLRKYYKFMVSYLLYLVEELN